MIQTDILDDICQSVYSTMPTVREDFYMDGPFQHLRTTLPYSFWDYYWNWNQRRMRAEVKQIDKQVELERLLRDALPSALEEQHKLVGAFSEWED